MEGGEWQVVQGIDQRSSRPVHDPLAAPKGHPGHLGELAGTAGKGVHQLGEGTLALAPHQQVDRWEPSEGLIGDHTGMDTAQHGGRLWPQGLDAVGDAAAQVRSGRDGGEPHHVRLGVQHPTERLLLGELERVGVEDVHRYPGHFKGRGEVGQPERGAH